MGAYLGGLAAHSVTNTLVQVAIITVAGRVLFGVEWPPEPVALVVFVAAGVVTFASLGVALSHAIPNFDSAPAYVNAIFLPVVFVSGVFYDADEAPAVLRDVAQALPLTHLIDGLSGAMVSGDVPWSALAVLVPWAALGTVLAIRGFSFEARTTR
jgi:ABC-2 type transport system permease protein